MRGHGLQPSPRHFPGLFGSEYFVGSRFSGARGRVVDTTDRLSRELAAGAAPATAYFAFTRFVVPNALYHMQVWGLFCTQDAWTEVDEAFTRFCAALCPLDLRPRIAGGSALRAELSLPQEF